MIQVRFYWTEVGVSQVEVQVSCHRGKPVDKSHSIQVTENASRVMEKMQVTGNPRSGHKSRKPCLDRDARHANMCGTSVQAKDDKRVPEFAAVSD